MNFLCDISLNDCNVAQSIVYSVHGLSVEEEHGQWVIF